MLIDTLLSSTILVFLHMNLFFLLAYLKKDNSIADIAWGLGFVVVAWGTALFNGNFGERQLLLNTLITLWGLRLAIYILIRNWGKKEDFRNKKMREDWGKKALINSWLKVFMLQGFFMLIISLSTIFVNTFKGSNVNLLDNLGLWVWVFGFVFETIGDYQLHVFSKSKKEKNVVLDTGLWKHTRHPNYFGEVTMWWGIYIIAFSNPYGILSILGPLLITFLIMKVSGIPMLEKKLMENPNYKKYAEKTSVFFPRI